MDTQRDLRIKIDPDWRKSKGYQEYADTAGKLGLAALNSATVFVGSVHEPNLVIEQIANAWMLQLFDASGNAPEDLKSKVLGFQEESMTFCRHYLGEAMRIEGIRIGLMLEAHGLSAAASLVKSTQV